MGSGTLGGIGSGNGVTPPAMPRTTLCVPDGPAACVVYELALDGSGNTTGAPAMDEQGDATRQATYDVASPGSPETLLHLVDGRQQPSVTIADGFGFSGVTPTIGVLSRSIYNAMGIRIPYLTLTPTPESSTKPSTSDGGAGSSGLKASGRQTVAGQTERIGPPPAEDPPVGPDAEPEPKPPVFPPVGGGPKGADEGERLRAAQQCACQNGDPSRPDHVEDTDADGTEEAEEGRASKEELKQPIWWRIWKDDKYLSWEMVKRTVPPLHLGCRIYSKGVGAVMDEEVAKLKGGVLLVRDLSALPGKVVEGTIQTVKDSVDYSASQDKRTQAQADLVSTMLTAGAGGAAAPARTLTLATGTRVSFSGAGLAVAPGRIVNVSVGGSAGVIGGGSLSTFFSQAAKEGGSTPRADSSAPNGKSGEKTGTVWDKIEGTQPNYPDTPIPRSFNIDTTSGHRFWVHGNATEHFFEHFTGSLKRSRLDKARIATQVHLKSFEAALDKLARQGYTAKTRYKIDGWELEIAPAPLIAQDKNPQVIHARYAPTK